MEIPCNVLLYTNMQYVNPLRTKELDEADILLPPSLEGIQDFSNPKVLTS